MRQQTIILHKKTLNAKLTNLRYHFNIIEY